MECGNSEDSGEFWTEVLGGDFLKMCWEIGQLIRKSAASCFKEKGAEENRSYYQRSWEDTGVGGDC